ncbi:MAG: hypothetical protein JNK35_00375 [Phycisphaerae bacterium]|nr:hypothetical protein [Phycisphaerae bacterium]
MHTARLALPLAALVLVSAGLGGCSNYRDSGGEPQPAVYLDSSAQRTIEAFKQTDPSLARFFDKSHAFVVIPKVTKGAVLAGAASGEGVVYQPQPGQAPKIVGYATLTQVTIGAQLGGQSYSEILFIQDAATFSNFKLGKTEFAANASAVLAKSGGGATNDYNQGVAVFVKPIEGVMAEAAIGGQSFKYRAAN